jgi:hypothetical protein
MWTKDVAAEREFFGTTLRVEAEYRRSKGARLRDAQSFG